MIDLILFYSRSHSPLSPKIRNMATKPNTAEDGEVTPAKELERLVKEVSPSLTACNIWLNILYKFILHITSIVRRLRSV